MAVPIATADLFDSAPDHVQVCDLAFRTFGSIASFAGRCVTLRCADHEGVAQILDEPGDGRVLLVDQCAGPVEVAVLGDRLADLALRNGWQAIVVNGAVRDAARLAGLPLAVFARSTTARRTRLPSSEWSQDLPITIGGAQFEPGDWIVGDEDAVVTCSNAIIDGFLRAGDRPNTPPAG